MTPTRSFDGNTRGARTRPLAAFGLLALACAAPATGAHAAPGQSPGRVRVYYFGNSLTENAMPSFHEELGRSAGKEWVVGALVASGAPLFHVRDKFEQDSWAFGGRARTTLTSQPWDAITLQPAQWLGLRRKGAETGDWVKDPNREVGDIESASGLIDPFLRAHPTGRVLLYADWPGMPALQGPGNAPQRPDDKVPNKEAFDYEAQWLKKYDPSARWQGNTFATRDYKYQLMEALKEKYPGLWTSGRLVMIPVGDVFFAINRKLRQGKLAGLTDIEDFYTDLIHARSGLPRYTVAATFFAVLFRENPAKLDWRLYNDAAKYRTTNEGSNPMRKFYTHLPDLGEHLEINAERAKLVNETIWEVVSEHPYTGLAAAPAK